MTKKIAFIIFVLLFLAVGLSVVLYMSCSWSESSKIAIDNFQDVQYDPNTKQMSKSFIIGKHIPYGYFSERLPNGKFRMISKVSDHDFECSGTCFCSDSGGNSRRNVNILSKGVFLILSAISTSIAIQFAGDFYRSECQTLFAESCGEGEFVDSRVDGCELLIREGVEEFGNALKYDCQGFCLPSRDLKRIESIEASMNFGCEEFSLKKTILIKEQKNYKLNPNMKAKEMFRTTFLQKYCKGISEFEYQYEYKWKETSKNLKSSVALCVADSSDFRIRNQNVFCYKSKM